MTILFTLAKTEVEWKDSQESTDDAVDDGAHAHVVGKHVKPVHDWRPSYLPWEVRPHQCEKHCHNIQHNALQTGELADRIIYTI